MWLPDLKFGTNPDIISRKGEVKFGERKEAGRGGGGFISEGKRHLGINKSTVQICEVAHSLGKAWGEDQEKQFGKTKLEEAKNKRSREKRKKKL